jgi:DNA-binding transcriptional LysR family regulator
MDRLRALSIFTVVAEETGFAPAARRLNLSPPTITRAIVELEEKLGARLLHRTTRTVSLTAAGERYYTDAKRILAELAEADRHAAGVHSAPRGEISVTGPMLFGRKIVAPILFDLLDHYPEISVTTHFMDRVVHLADEGIDIAVRIADLPDSSLSAIRVGEVRRVICASPDYLARRGQPQRPEDFGRT